MPADLSPDARVSLTRLAHELGVSTSTVWRWTLRGVRGHRLPTMQLGGRRYVARADFADWLAATQDDPAPTPPAPATSRQREAAIRAAERELAAAGV
ncbi:MAG: hypothetical protein DCC67_11465 [Planctomycetota bacterium]|nr:MAG: hypothetical protein DCC67_11465 [Planctomycetota bacterium]